MSEYQVLARKYRPKKLSELVGQDVLVRTLASAISQNRIPHAFILTGIRGVGKTSTARIIARSLLCTGNDENNDKPTVDPCGVCKNCTGVQNDNHIDVIEVDAASRTGVNDIREIIDQVNYSPVMGRLKIYIIDEVHMLSKSAFNALLKTLEEPPPHVKFIFATTEIRKIPITILSRCMRFDLPRVSIEKLIGHFKNIAFKEKILVDDDALKIIASGAEGSVRDGLSLLDQAIAVSAGEKISAQQIREMIGIADKDQLYDLLSNMFDGKFENSLQILGELYAKGVDPILVIKDLMEITHFITLTKASDKIAKQSFVSETEKNKSEEISTKTDVAALTRMWQILNKGIEDARFCPSPLMAAEMVVMRSCFASGLPTPSEIIEKLGGDEPKKTQPKNDIAPDIQPTMFAEKKTLNSALPAQTAAKADKQVSYNTHHTATAPVLKTIVNETPVVRQDSLNLSVPADYKELVNLFISKKDNFIATWLEEVKLINYDANAGVIKISAQGTPAHINIKDISKKLFDWCGKRFVISLENTANTQAKSINDEKQEELEKRKNEAINSTAVQALLKEFNGAAVTSVEEIF